MSDFDHIKQELEKEITEWETLVATPPVIPEIEQLRLRVGSLNECLREAQTTLSEILDDLIALPGLVRESLGQTNTVLDQAAGTFLETARELATSLGERSTEVLERTGQTASAEFAELLEFVSDEFLDKVAECYDINVATVCEACSELRDEVEEQLEEFMETTKEQVTELTDKLDELGEEWKEAVSDLSGEYIEVCEQIVTLGEDVTDLTEAIETALHSTAIGMNAATGSIDDIKAIMGGIV